jgi:hypothetical protein
MAVPFSYFLGALADGRDPANAVPKEPSRRGPGDSPFALARRIGHDGAQPPAELVPLTASLGLL